MTRSVPLVLCLLLFACARAAPPPSVPAGPASGDPEPAPEPRPVERVEVEPAAGAGPAAPADQPPPDAAAAAPAPATEPAVPTVADPSERRVEPAPRPVVPRRLRVGLATDLAEVAVPCCGVRVGAGGEWLVVGGSARVTPAARRTVPAVLRIQVAALRDEGQAEGLARRLAGELGEAAEAVFDAASGLYRVRAGRYSDRSRAEQALRRLELLGVRGAWIASEEGELGDPGLGVAAAGVTRRVPGRWLSVEPAAGDGVSWGGRRYRGRLLVYLNDRGRLNVINELPLEEYLRGVVPRELGPDLYPSLEALKAQSVAARTYTVRNRDDFRREGYDICATPRCQVYGGREAEHPLSDQAVAETAGEVLVHGGELADTLYTASCGGHTEDARFVFPTKDHVYLDGVPCAEGGVRRLAPASAPQSPFPAGVTRHLPGPPGAVEPAPGEIGGRLAALARAAAPIPEDRLASLAAAEVRRFLASVLDLTLDLRVLAPAVEVRAELARGAPAWDRGERELARFLLAEGLLDPGGALDPARGELLVLHLAIALGLLDATPAGFVDLASGALEVATPAGRRTYGVSDELATYRRRGDGHEPGPLELFAGDPLTLYRRDGELVGVRHDVETTRAPRPGERWRRFRTDGGLAALVARRYPGLDLVDFTVLRRGVSGRVAAMRLEGRDGRRVDVEGLAVRWTFDLPDTWFTAVRSDRSEGRGWLFDGRGRGHGVGMCQIGAFGMGRRGADYRRILAHYYGGAAVVRAAVEGGGPVDAAMW